jgi:thymidylate kinase
LAAAYEEIAERHADRIVVVDGSGSPEDVHGRVMEVVRAR